MFVKSSFQMATASRTTFMKSRYVRRTPFSFKKGAIPEVATAGSVQMRGVDASGEYTLRYFIARSLSLGDLDLQQVPMAVVSEMVIGAESKSGILGGNILVSALVDTGSQCCLAQDCLLESIQREKLGDERIRGPWLSLVQCEKVRLKNIKVGEHKFDAPIFAVYQADKASATGKFIVLGNDVLRRFRTVTFDYPGRRLILEPK